MTKRNTPQKELIYKIVKESCNHPTAEMVYDIARKEIENISLGTVYRILNDLSKNNDILEISVPNNKNRYDKTLLNHGHFVCSKCGEVHDIYFNEMKFFDSLSTFNDKDVKINLVLDGLCDKCKKEEAKYELNV